MIGLGNWVCHVDTMFFRGDAHIKLFDNNGEYGFELTLPDMDIPEIAIKDVSEDGKHPARRRECRPSSGQRHRCHFNF